MQTLQWSPRFQTKRVTGIGGIFFKAENPERLYEWYEKHLGIEREPHGHGATLHWREDENPERRSATAWAIFEKSLGVFRPQPRTLHAELSRGRSGRIARGT